MKLIVVILAGLLTASCSISVVDKRLTREEVIQAFKQRDQALDTLVNAINAIRKDYPPKKELKK